MVSREQAPPPIATTVFRLSEWGRQLRPAIHELGRWGAPLMADASDDDEFRSHWLALPIEVQLRGQVPKGPATTLEVWIDGQPTTLEVVDGKIESRAGEAADPDGVLSGSLRLVTGVLTGSLSLGAARKQGLSFRGDEQRLRRSRETSFGRFLIFIRVALSLSQGGVCA